MNWNDGYVSNIDYPAAFFREQSPTHLSFACVLNGYEPVPLDGHFTYMELGAGQGLTANILAASHPRGEFYAVDFSPSQVAASRQLSAAAQLNNLTLLENSFAELAAGKVALPQLDFITMYGVYSWVDADNRRHIADFINRYLKPGGIVYLNYNAMPGWTAALPLQRLILEYAQRDSHPRPQQVEHVRALVGGLVDSGADFFKGNPDLQYRIDSLMRDKAHYLAHEYMSTGWRPLYHADVVRDMASAKLDYIGSGELSRSFPQLFLTPEQLDLLQTVPDPALRETIKDYLTNTSFREDIFVRGARRMTPARQEHWLRQVGLALTALPGQATLALKLAIGNIEVDAATYQPVLDALALRPHTLDELAALPALAGCSLLQIGEMAALLTASDQASAYFTRAAATVPDAARKMNAAVAQASLFGDQYQALASPLLGNGLKSGLVQRLVYGLLQQEAEPADTVSWARRIGAILRSQGLHLSKDGKALVDEDDMHAELCYLTEAIVRQRAPVWRALHML
jgi:SAM-dependent methyltransferase